MGDAEGIKPLPRRQPGKNLIPPADAPDFATPELLERWHEMRALMQANAEGEAELQPYGAGIMAATAFIQRMRAVTDTLAAEAGVDPPRFPAQQDMVMAANVQFNALLHVLFPAEVDGVPSEENQRLMLEFDMAYQQSLAQFLTTAKSQVIQAQLAQGANLSPEMMRSLAKASNQITNPQRPNGLGPGGLILPGG